MNRYETNPKSKKLNTYLGNIVHKVILKILNKIASPISIKYHNRIQALKKEKIKKLIPFSLAILKKSNDCISIWQEISPDCPIFIMWWQGLNYMPPIVQLCYQQLTKNSGDHPIEFISKDNISDVFIRRLNRDIPCNFIEWLTTGKISIQHFSDIIRTYLIYNVGGIWIDATIFLNRPIDEIILNKKFYSGKRQWENTIHSSPAEERFTTYFFSAGINNKLVGFIHNGLTELIISYGKIPEYLTMDYLFAIAYENDCEIRHFIDELQCIEPLILALSDSDKPIKEELFIKLIRSMPFFKMNWRSKGEELDKNKNPTIYKKLKDLSSNT